MVGQAKLQSLLIISIYSLHVKKCLYRWTYTNADSEQTAFPSRQPDQMLESQRTTNRFYGVKMTYVCGRTALHLEGDWGMFPINFQNYKPINAFLAISTII